jgi:hypothetical protein
MRNAERAIMFSIAPLTSVARAGKFQTPDRSTVNVLPDRPGLSTAAALSLLTISFGGCAG